VSDSGKRNNRSESAAIEAAEKNATWALSTSLKADSWSHDPSPLPTWARPFDDPILLPGGRQLVTPRDAADYIMKLPKAEQDLEEWQTAIGCLTGAAEGRDILSASAWWELSIGALSGCSLHRESIRIGDAGEPALTGSADIKLNTRLSLRAPTEKIASRTGYFRIHRRKAVGQYIFRPTVLFETGYRSHD
jgi:hypothetical protein